MATSFTTHSAGQTITSADVNLIQTAVNALENAPSPSSNPPGQWTPTAHGFTSWLTDPMTTAAAGFSLSTGVWNVSALQIPAGTVTNLFAYVTSAGSATNFIAALYGPTGTLLSASVNLTANASSTGLKTFPLAVAQAVAAGAYYVGIGYSGGSGFNLLKGAGGVTTLNNMNLSGAFRSATSGTAFSTAAPTPLGTLSASAVGIWVATS